MSQSSTCLGSLPSIQEIARIMGGEVHGSQASVPGPGHSTKDRSLSIKLDPAVPDGFLVHSFAGDDPFACKDYVRKKIGLPCRQDRRHRRIKRAPLKSEANHPSHAEHQLKKARWLWSIRKSPQKSPVESYLRKVRGYSGRIPATIGFLPPQKSEYKPAMITAFGLANEPEPGFLSIEANQVCGVHLTLLKPDGSDKAGTDRDKLMVGPSNGWPLVLAPLNDLLGLFVCEGIESGLSLYEATGCGVWAAGSASRMAALADKVPSYINCVTIIGEADTAGKKGAVGLSQRLNARGLHTELKFLANDEARAA